MTDGGVGAPVRSDGADGPGANERYKPIPSAITATALRTATTIRFGTNGRQ
jgi:hypothetical protein